MRITSLLRIVKFREKCKTENMFVGKPRKLVIMQVINSML